MPRLYTRRPFMQRFEEKIEMIPECGCWIWTAATNIHGYGLFIFNGKMQSTHRISWQVYRGAIPAGMFILHRCDTRLCVNPNHLRIGTQKENIQECHSKGRAGYKFGEHNGQSILLESQVLQIMSDSREHYIIAKDYNISSSLVSALKKGKRWQHITTKYEKKFIPFKLGEKVRRPPCPARIAR